MQVICVVVCVVLYGARAALHCPPLGACVCACACACVRACALEWDAVLFAVTNQQRAGGAAWKRSIKARSMKAFHTCDMSA